MKLFSLFFSVVTMCPLLTGAEPVLSRPWLLEGCETPERREFPTNPSVKPCDDFYSYACSKVKEGFKLRDDRSQHTFSFGDSAERLLCAKKKYLKALTELKTVSPRTQRLKNFYLACMDADDAKKEELSIVDSELKKVAALQDRAAFETFLADRIDQPEKSFVGFDSIPNQDEPKWNDVVWEADLMTLPERSYYDKPEVVKDLEELATDFFKTIHLSDPEKRAKEVVAFEKAFAQVHPLPAEMRKRMTERDSVTKTDLVTKYPALKLDKVLRRIPDKTKLRNMIPESMAFLNNALEKEPLDVLKNVYLFHDLPGYMDDAYPDFFKKRFDFDKKNLGGPEVRPVREERCTKQIMGKFAKEIDVELLPILFPGFPETKVVSLAENIRESILKELKSNQWLSPSAKKAAMHKIKVANLLIVRPRNDGEWNFTPPAEYNPKAPYQNSKTLQLNLIEKEIRELHEPRNRRRWLMGPLTVNAYYMPMDNVFVLPMGILQYPFYDPTLPDFVNTAAIGAVVGHELGHGIDDQGSQFDSEGRLKKWMTDNDLKEFHARGDKFIERFNQIGHNGSLTLGENIGDHVGLTSAYLAAFPPGKGSIDDKKAFFLQYGRAWCEVARPKFQEMRLKTNPHAIGEARVNEQVRHQNGFQEAYGCKQGDKMYLAPTDRVRVW